MCVWGGGGWMGVWVLVGVWCGAYAMWPKLWGLDGATEFAPPPVLPCDAIFRPSQWRRGGQRSGEEHVLDAL